MSRPHACVHWSVPDPGGDPGSFDDEDLGIFGSVGTGEKGALICYGALGSALPPFLQRTNRRGAQRNILLVQGGIVTAISAVYLVMKNVSSAFFLISSLVVGLYIIMYMLMFAAAIRLRYTLWDPAG